MVISKVRRENLNGLIAEHGTIKALGERARVSENLLSQYRSEKKNMGSKFARKLEWGLGKPIGWMDAPQFAGMGLGDDHSEAVRIVRSLPTKALRRHWLELGRKLSKRE